jgi:hypothetical protein
MEIISSPGPINLSGNLPKIIGHGLPNEVIDINLFLGAEKVLEEVYLPDANGVVEIDYAEVISTILEIALPGSDLPVFIQGKGYAEFELQILSNLGPNLEMAFKVVKGGVNYELTNFTGFLTQSFLSWQPQFKTIKSTDQEWLTYYAQVASVVKVKAYFADNTSAIKTLVPLEALKLQSINVKFSLIDTLFNEQPTSPVIYDVWVEDTAGLKLSYSQRYIISKEYFEFDQVFLFENSIGGIDTIRFTGECVEQDDITFKRALFDKITRDINIDALKIFKKNTGAFRTPYERKWALEFFTSLQKYEQRYMEFVQIYVQNLKLSTTPGELNSGDFEYVAAAVQEYFSTDRDLGALADPHFFPADPEEPLPDYIQRIFTPPFKNQFA